MHARIDQLLSLRDGEPVEADAVRHVEACPACAAELVRLKHVQQRLQSLASFEPPSSAWEQVSARARTPEAPRRNYLVPMAAAAAALIVVGIGVIVRQQDVSSHPPSAPVVTVAPAAELADPAPPLEQLVAQSRELDEMLQYLPARPSVERVAMAATIDTIEQRIQWLDVQLSYAPDSQLNDAQAYRLWRERVDLMDSLVKVRYAEGGHLSF